MIISRVGRDPVLEVIINIFIPINLFVPLEAEAWKTVTAVMLAIRRMKTRAADVIIVEVGPARTNEVAAVCRT